jgi:hypothetical protein
MSDYFYSLGMLVHNEALNLDYGWGAVLDALDLVADEENQ